MVAGAQTGGAAATHELVVNLDYGQLYLYSDDGDFDRVLGAR